MIGLDVRRDNRREPTDPGVCKTATDTVRIARSGGPEDSPAGHAPGECPLSAERRETPRPVKEGFSRFEFSRHDWCMNKKGHPATLVAAHPANLNAVRSGVHSPRVLAARTADYREALRSELEPPRELEFALHEVARLAALIDAIDHALDVGGIINRRGKPHYLLAQRIRVSRQFEQWHDKLLAGCGEASRLPAQLAGERTDYVAELQHIALRDGRASTAERLRALSILLREGRRGTASGALSDEARRTAAGAEQLAGRRFERAGETWVELERVEATS